MCPKFAARFLFWFWESGRLNDKLREHATLFLHCVVGLHWGGGLIFGGRGTDTVDVLSMPIPIRGARTLPHCTIFNLRCAHIAALHNIQSAVRAHCRTAQPPLIKRFAEHFCTLATLGDPGTRKEKVRKHVTVRERWEILKSISGRQNPNNYSDTETRPCLDCWCMYLLRVLFKFRLLYLPNSCIFVL